ncbi:MAG: glycosyltransferase [Candidatus Eisenbacteria bacterium]|uniref:Glycosyltransferase n=1 Tax=Eiseniibacteriota bacterium TaxID=2212470 RepID=A0A538T7V5_UNCEI|nr:MAG: glycosyltransferase [Candidatus Eisenbacteria bacterium]
MHLSLIVIHYHTRAALGRLLQSLREAPPEPLREVLIVNNSGEPIEDLVEGVPARILVPGRNLGYARGVNEGIRAAREEAVLILNPDIQVLPGSIEALVRCAGEHPRAGILAPRLLNPDGTLQLSARRFYNWRTLLLRRAPLGPYAARSRTLRNHLMADWDHAETRAVDWVLGAAMLAPKRAVRDVGLMDERYFLYFEDVDWCQRMWRHGYEVLYCADASMVHEYTRGSAQLRARSIRAHAAGLLRFAEKWSAVLYAVSQNRKRLLALATLATDVLSAALAFLGAYAIRASLAPVFAKPIYPLPSYGGLLFFTVAVTLAALTANGLYRRSTFLDAIERAFSIGQAVIQAVLFLMAATFLFQTPRYSRVLVLLLAPLLYGALLATRTLVGRLGAGARRQGFAFRRVLVVGSGSEAERAREALEETRGEGFEPLKTAAPAEPGEPPEAAAARLKTLVESERIQIVCVVPQPDEVPYLLAAATALRDSGAAVYWAGSVAQLAAEESLGSLGRLRAVLLHSPSRGLSLRVRKRASDLLLSIFVAPFRWGALRAYLAGRGERYGPAEAWGRVWSGRLSWVGRSAYEADRWAGVPGWARLALESVRPGVVTPPDGASGDPMAKVAAELAYLSRFSLAEDLRVFLRATRGTIL